MGTTPGLRQDLFDLKIQSARDCGLKSLIAVAGIVAGVIGLIFLSLYFVPFAIGTLIVSSFALHHLVREGHHVNKVLQHIERVSTVQKISPQKPRSC